jgi:1,4-alpha-glucan branching enzyme
VIRRKRATNGHIGLTFALPDEGVPVSVVGDFNAWDPHRNPLRKRSNGTRSVTVELLAGEVARFRYLDATGRFFDDPDGDAIEPNGLGETHTVVLV